MPSNAVEKRAKQTAECKRKANEILDSLERWSRRIGNHFTQKRDKTRQPFRELITIDIPESESSDGEADQRSVIQVWTRDISQSGLGFVYHERIAGDQIVICLNLPGRNSIKVDATIVRRRPMQNGFWEFGVEFNAREVM